MTDPSTTPHPSLNAIDPHTGGLAAIWTIRSCPTCEPGLVADGAVSEPCREHGGDPRISPTFSGQQSAHALHEPLHSEALARDQGRPGVDNPMTSLFRLLPSIVTAAGLLAFALPAQAETLSGQARIIDGDTLAVAGERIRLNGIDAPETGQACGRNGRQWACGKASTQAMQRLIGRNEVRCRIGRRDKYGRAIGACFVNGRDLQQELVRQGLALAYRKYSTRYVPDEDEAREAQRGLWSGSFIEPWRWRRHQKSRSTSSHRRQPQTAPSRSAGACLIKGNISASGRIYHVPGGMYYDRTRIDESRGERWFCSEAEARAAGWRRSGR